MKVEGTLWAIGTITMASLISLLVEIAFRSFTGADDLRSAVTERLACVEDTLAQYARDGVPDTRTETALTRFASVGTSRLRRMLQRSSHTPRYAHAMETVVAVVGRLVDLAASLAQFRVQGLDCDRAPIAWLARSVADVRADLRKGEAPHPVNLFQDLGAPPCLPLLLEMENSVSDSRSIRGGLPITGRLYLAASGYQVAGRHS